MITETKEVNTGIGEKNRKDTVAGINKYLADTYALYLKTQNFHWNVTGPLFESLHKMFEEQYHEMAAAIDKIAERIRALGFKAPGSFSEFSKLTSIKEGSSSLNDKDMVQALIEDHEAISRTARTLFVQAEEVNDPATADMLAERMDNHEKFAWMLKSINSKS